MLKAKEIKKMLEPTIIKILEWNNRKQRRSKHRQSVKNKSLATCHPSEYNHRQKIEFEKAAAWQRKAMCKAYRKLSKEFWDKGLWLFRKLLNKFS